MQLVFTCDSSGTLQKQIEQGAVCDVFISAAQKQMDALQEQDLIDPDTRFDLLENRVVLVVPEGDPASVGRFDDLVDDRVRLIALGYSDVPVGQYAQELFENMGIWQELQPKITFGSNVKEVTTQVAEGVVDCGVVYATDAVAAGLAAVDEADHSQLQARVIYPAAALRASEHPQQAADFLAFLKTEEACRVLRAAGFSAPI